MSFQRERRETTRKIREIEIATESDELNSSSVLDLPDLSSVATPSSGKKRHVNDLLLHFIDITRNVEIKNK